MSGSVVFRAFPPYATLSSLRLQDRVHPRKARPRPHPQPPSQPSPAPHSHSSTVCLSGRFIKEQSHSVAFYEWVLSLRFLLGGQASAPHPVLSGCGRVLVHCADGPSWRHRWEAKAQGCLGTIWISLILNSPGVGYQGPGWEGCVPAPSGDTGFPVREVGPRLLSFPPRASPSHCRSRLSQV